MASIMGTEPLLSPMPTILGIRANIVTKGRMHNLRVRSHEGLVRMHNQMYHRPDVPCLMRKRLVFEDVLDMIEVASQKPHYGKKKLETISGLLEQSKGVRICR